MIKDKTIIVTGAARGLGQKYALEFAKAEANIIFADISDCSETEKKVSEVTDKFLSLNLDVTDINSCNNMMAKAVDKFSKIDVLVNNAALYGALKSSRFEDIDPDQWDKAMNVNVKGLWNCCRAISPIMRENKSGSILNIASLAAKFEMGKDNIRVNAVAPSMVRTESAKEFLGEKAERGFEVISKGQILQKTLEVDDIYGTVLYLASDQSKFVTGQTLMVDGGSVLL